MAPSHIRESAIFKGWLRSKNCEPEKGRLKLRPLNWDIYNFRFILNQYARALFLTMLMGFLMSKRNFFLIQPTCDVRLCYFHDLSRYKIGNIIESNFMEMLMAQWWINHIMRSTLLLGYTAFMGLLLSKYYELAGARSKSNFWQQCHFYLLNIGTTAM